MEFLHTLHAHNKYLVLTVLLGAIIVMLTTAARGAEFGKLPRIFYALVHAVVGIQVVVGAVLAVQLGLGVPYRVEHLGTMVLAFLLLNLTIRFKREPGPARARKTGLALVGVLALIVVGVLRLPYPFFGGHGAPAVEVPTSAPAPASH